MREIVWRPRASADLDGILVYIGMELDSPNAAETTANAIFDAIERVAELPEIGHVFFDEDLNHAYRRILVKSYWVYYSYDNDTLVVWRIYHTLRDLDHYGFEIFEKQ